MRPPRMDTAQLSLVRQPFNDPKFLFELKHDGFRALAHIWDGKCELVSRRRNPYKSFQELRDNLATLKVENAIIDGELVCLDAEGRSIFNELLHRKGCRGRAVEGRICEDRTGRKSHEVHTSAAGSWNDGVGIAVQTLLFAKIWGPCVDPDERVLVAGNRLKLVGF